jgi:hypothetical protein
MPEDPYYWLFRCPQFGGALTRIDVIRLSDEDAEKILGDLQSRRDGSEVSLPFLREGT